MTSIAQAYVEILPSARGMQGALSRELGGVEAGLSQSTRRGFLGGFARIGGAVTGAIGAIGIGAAIGSTISKGLGRALNLQDARAQLAGLGHDAESVETVMASALDSVRGTAFGLDAAATTAAGAVAAGVKPGADLTRSLSLVADAATIAGTDMGSMGAIFNKVAASDMIQGDVLAQLGDQGIPILQFLADELGTTSGAVREMASRGEIDFATFQSAMEKGLGGAALQSGETARGALANIGAAVGRLSAMFTGGAVEAAPQLFQAIAGAIDRAAEALSPLAEGLSGMITPAIEGLAGLIDGIDFSNISGGLMGLLEGGTELRAGLFDTAVAAIPGLVDGFVAALPQVVGFIAGTLIPQVVNQLASLVSAVAGVVAEIVPGIAAVLPDIVAAVLTLVPAILAALVGALPQILQAASQLFLALVDAVVLVVPQLIAAIVGVLPSIVSALLTMLPTLLEAAIGLFMQLVAALITVIPQLLTAIVAMLPGILATLVEMIPMLLAGAIGLFMQIVNAVFQIVPQLLLAIIGMLPVIVSTLVSLIPVLLEAAILLFTSLLDGLIENLPLILDFLIFDMIPAIVNAIISAAPRLLDAGVALIQAFIDGIGSMLGAVGEAVGGIVDFVAGFFPNSPAKRGPLSGAGWRAIGKSGGAIEDAFASGFTGRIDDVLTSGVNVPRVPVSAEVASYAAGRGGSPVNVTIETSQALDEYLVADVAANALARALR